MPKYLITSIAHCQSFFVQISRMIAAALAERGVRLEFLLDEGGGRLRGAAAFGAPGVLVSDINLMEKGYADLELSVESRGGHSSRPFGGTSLGVLAEAIAAITAHPIKPRVDSLLRRAFLALGDCVTDEGIRALLDAEDWDGLAARCMAEPELFPYVATTVAPTMIEGGSQAANVLPQNMRAVINFRLAPGETTESLMAHCQAVTQGQAVKLRYLQANDPSAIARCDGYGYRKLTEAMAAFLPEVLFVPCLTAGATDARRYERICDTCLRCSPFMAEAEDVRTGVHGTNERLPVRSYAQGIRILIRLMELANVEG